MGDREKRGATEKGRQCERVRDTDREKPGQPGKKGHRLMLLAHQDGGDGGHSPVLGSLGKTWALQAGCVTAASRIFQNSSPSHLLSLFFTRKVETLTAEGLETDMTE